MADVKITGLTAISTVDTANDPLPIVDVSDTSMATTGTTKKVTVNQILAAGANGVFGAGTQAAPSISTTGDTDTGVYFPAADTVGITTNATEKARIDSAGSLMVGGQTSYASFAGAAGGITGTIQAQSDAGTASVGVVQGTTTKDSICLFSDGSNVGLGTNQTKTVGFTAAPPIKFYTGGLLRAQIPGVTIVNNEGFVTYTNDAILNGVRVGRGVANISSNLTIGGLGNASTVGGNNTAIGIASLNLATSASGSTAVGGLALGSATTGGLNTAVGYTALGGVTTGFSNTAIGYSSGSQITTSTNSTLVGSNIGASGSYNVVIGSGACQSSTSNQNVVVGALSAVPLTTGKITSVGYASLNKCTTGTENTAVGWQSQFDVTTGIRNTSVGSASGYTVTTGSDNTALGYGAGWGAATASGRIALGKGVTATGNNRITIGIDSNIAELDLDGADTSWAASSDERLKKNIQNLGTGLSFVTSLRPVSFQWRSKREVPVELANLHADSDEPVHGDAAKVYHGFIAQEVKASIDAHPEVVSGQHFWESREDGVQTLAPADLVPVLVNCIKELNARLSALENK